MLYYLLTTFSSHKPQKEHQAIITMFSDVQNVLYIGVSNGPIKFESARKIWPLLELLAKIR